MIELNEKGNIEDARSRNKDIGDEVVTKAELRTMLQHADIRQKALFLTLVSSGLRITEALKLMPKDIDFDSADVACYPYTPGTSPNANFWGCVANTGDSPDEDNTMMFSFFTDDSQVRLIPFENMDEDVDKICIATYLGKQIIPNEQKTLIFNWP